MTLSKDTRKEIIRLHTAMVESQTWKCCCNCVDFDEHKMACNRFNAKPPAKVIVVGCEEHADDIPF